MKAQGGWKRGWQSLKSSLRVATLRKISGTLRLVRERKLGIRYPRSTPVHLIACKRHGTGTVAERGGTETVAGAENILQKTGDMVVMTIQAIIRHGNREGCHQDHLVHIPESTGAQIPLPSLLPTPTLQENPVPGHLCTRTCHRGDLNHRHGGLNCHHGDLNCHHGDRKTPMCRSKPKDLMRQQQMMMSHFCAQPSSLPFLQGHTHQHCSHTHLVAPVPRRVVHPR